MKKMPALFLGHGSPMNAIEENEFVKGFRTIGREIPKPDAILCISAHWETRGPFVTAMEKPKSISENQCIAAMFSGWGNSEHP